MIDLIGAEQREVGVAKTMNELRPGSGNCDMENVRSHWDVGTHPAVLEGKGTSVLWRI